MECTLLLKIETMTKMVELTVLCGIQRLEVGGMSVVEACGPIATISDLVIEFSSIGSGIHSNSWRSRFNRITATIRVQRLCNILLASYLIMQLHTIAI